jgi:iron complex outermembrane receptor protein
MFSAPSKWMTSNIIGRIEPQKPEDPAFCGAKTGGLMLAFRKEISCFAFVVASAWSAPLLAQDAAADTSADNSEIIVTAQQARKQVESGGSLGVLGNKDALSTPFNLSSYTAQLILDQQSETIGDVLENDPAVRTTYGSGNQSELFVIRGFALNGDDVAIDGLYGITPRQLVSPELYDSVQVLNGASAFLFGAAPGGSIGGAINLIPKRATKTLFRATASYIGDSIVGGNFDVGTRLGEDKAVGVRLVGVLREGDSSIDHEQRKVRAGGLDLDFSRGAGRIYVDLGYEFQRADWTRPIVRLSPGIAVPKPPRARANYGQPWAFTRLRDIYGLAKAELDIAEDWMIYAAAGFRDGREDGEYSTVTVTNAATGAGTGSRLFVPRADSNQSGMAGIRGKLETGPITHEVNGGGSVTFMENRNSFTFGLFDPSVRASATAFFTNLYNTPIVAKPTNSTLPSSGGNLTQLPRVATSELMSVYASDTLGVMDGKVQLTLGARSQHMVIDAWNRGTGARTTRYDEDATTPIVGLIVRPTENLSFYANRIEGLQQGPTAPLNANTTNAGEVFAPFKSTQYEAGAKIAIRGLTGTIAAYQTKQPSAFLRPVAGSATLVTFVVEGEQRNRGLELTLNGEPTKWLRFIGGLSINDAKLTRKLNWINDGNKAIGVPDYQVNLGVEYVPSFLKNATLTARLVRTGKQYLDLANTQAVPTWTRFDAGIRYVAVIDDHPVTFRVSVENLANKSYWYSGFGGYLLLGTPRTAKASVTFEY